MVSTPWASGRKKIHAGWRFDFPQDMVSLYNHHTTGGCLGGPWLCQAGAWQPKSIYLLNMQSIFC
jgi:hypothetical protein